MRDDTGDTIAAVSTPAGKGGIGIIRISGPEAFAAAKKIFRASLSSDEAASAKVFDALPSHSLRHGYAVSPASGKVLDECLFGKMSAPATYTCEDVVEVNCHGGMAVMRSILQELFASGVRPANPGEFTKRAFLGGRIDLAEAEGVMDIINARTEGSRAAAEKQLDGRFSAELKEMSRRLEESIGEIEVALEYPEYEMDVP
ncbi:MAG: tRNA uridine-5-carboxymethylaminomethyl(34) synthesis GTPase MnmE, partial [Firmicutes bacterium]|nr:tRNA uridine-5-carboxymethylaminomethyl(34) synthesis GTPase MnmE [Bacillota bacterium]